MPIAGLATRSDAMHWIPGFRRASIASKAAFIGRDCSIVFLGRHTTGRAPILPVKTSLSLAASKPFKVFSTLACLIRFAAWLNDLGLSMPLELDCRLRCARPHVKAGADVTLARRVLSPFLHLQGQMA
ncbi:g11136 [Coccomyxa viridis]|uniref:G11136 protein n=1 Tax=Coccomyxa viridis TaxID=1274662 RepID=A0ABP1GD05_9CHLO